MTIKKEMTNLEIFNLANLLLENFDINKDYNFPVKINFYLQKNMTTIVEMAKELEQNRIAIIKKYGVPQEDNPEKYIVEQDKINIANSELEDLFNLTQEVSVNMLKLDWFDNIELTSGQVHAISFMISEE